jgi:superfamily I DNA/RNA helicase
MLMPGEKMIADSPIKNEQGIIILTTNAEFVVKEFDVSATIHTAKIGDQVIARNEYKYYDTDIETMNTRGKIIKQNIRVLHEDCVKAYTHTLELFKIRIAQIGDAGMRAGAWRSYYDLFNLFAKVKYNYAITAHKAQGSSYENCMMIEWDMYENTRYEERNRIRYVAATRARKYLFIIK